VPIFNFPNLQEFIIENTSNTDDGFFVRDLPLRYVQYSHALQYFHSNITTYEDICLKLASSLPQLETFGIDIDDMSPATLNKMLSLLSNLKSLAFNTLSSLPFEENSFILNLIAEDNQRDFISAMKENLFRFPHTKNVEIHSCDHVDNDFVTEVFRVFENIAILDLDRVPETDNNVFNNVKSPYSALESLHLTSSSLIWNNEVREIGFTCEIIPKISYVFPNLTTLTLKRFGNIEKLMKLMATEKEIQENIQSLTLGPLRSEDINDTLIDTIIGFKYLEYLCLHCSEENLRL